MFGGENLELTDEISKTSPIKEGKGETKDFSDSPNSKKEQGFLAVVDTTQFTDQLISLSL